MKKTALLLLIVSFLFLPESTTAMGKSPKEKTEPSNKKQVNQLPSRGFVSSFDVSPDGKYIVFAVRFEKIGMNYLKSDIWRMNIDGTNLKRLTHTANAPRNKKAVSIARKGYKSELIPYQTIGAERPEFSPQGNFVIYSLERTSYVMGGRDAREQPMIMDNDGSEQKEIKPMVLSPDETKYIRFIQAGPYRLRKHTLTIFDAQTDKILAEVPDIYGGSFPDFSVRRRIFWSPDSKRIAFTGSKEPEEPKAKSKPPVYLWIVDADGNNLREVTWAAAGFNTISWSPDAKKIMIATGGREVLLGSDRDYKKASGIWVIDLENNREYKVSRDLRAGGGKWSRDGTKILFSGGGTLSNVYEKIKSSFYVASPDAVSLTRILEGGALSYTLAGDGKYILYVPYITNSHSFQKGNDLWILSIDGSLNKKITDDLRDAYPRGYHWVKSKKGIVYLTSGNLWFMDIGTLIPNKLTNLISDDR